VILCVGQVANMVTGAWQVVLPMTGHRRQILRVSMAAAVVQFSCSIVGGYAAGVLGVAIGVAAGAVAGNVLGLIAVRKHLSIWTFISMRRAVLVDAVTLLTKRIAGLGPARPRDA
jgi:ABC-type microcin C transport system permease subunit YejE